DETELVDEMTDQAEQNQLPPVGRRQRRGRRSAAAPSGARLRADGGEEESRRDDQAERIEGQRWEVREGSLDDGEVAAPDDDRQEQEEIEQALGILARPCRIARRPRPYNENRR